MLLFIILTNSAKIRILYTPGLQERLKQLHYYFQYVPLKFLHLTNIHYFNMDV